MRFPLALLCAFFAAGSLHAADAKRPNILFCFADDWGRYASAYAAVDGRPGPNDVVRTPNIDAVAKRGVLFRNAFVNAPSCTPCRSSLLTGRYFFRCNRGAILEGAVWDESLPTSPLLLRDAGYHIGKAGKVWSPGKPADEPIGGQKYAYEKAGLKYHKFSDNATASVKAGLSVEAAKEKLLDASAGEFSRVPGRGRGGEAVVLFLRPDEYASHLDGRLGQGAVGHRSGFAPGEDARLPARHARGARRLRGLPRRGGGVRRDGRRAHAGTEGRRGDSRTRS